MPELSQQLDIMQIIDIFYFCRFRT